MSYMVTYVSLNLSKLQLQMQVKENQQLSVLNKHTIHLRKQSLESTDDEKSIEKSTKQNSSHTKIKFKTELCKNFSENGFCRYGKKCRFAHGYKQLKQGKVVKSQHYRTKKCHSFWTFGQCSYGSRCQFSHHQEIDKRQILFICKQTLCEPQTDHSCSRLFTLLD